jgi:eukaryotic-like serine/threonine-protein kinase
MTGWESSDATSKELIREHFLKLLDASPGERDAVLEESCGVDGEMRRQVQELLSAHGDADEMLWSLARRVRIPLAGAQSEFFAEGRRLGAYHLLRQIGQGGMGAVYLAERADGEFRKQVAVKLLPLGLSTGAARERFRAERQILAQLEHPGIARLLDAGLAEDGTPFFVMEYVEGEPIDRYCERRKHGIVRVASISSFRSALRWSTRTATLSSTATSSRATSWSRRRGWRSSWTSASLR